MDFRDKMKNYKPEVDTEAWMQMESLLNNTSNLPIESSVVSQATALWVKLGKLLGVLGVVVVIGYLTSVAFLQQDDQNQVSEVRISDDSANTKTSITSDENQMSDATNSTASARIESNKLSAEQSINEYTVAQGLNNTNEKEEINIDRKASMEKLAAEKNNLQNNDLAIDDVKKSTSYGHNISSSLKNNQTEVEYRNSSVESESKLETLEGRIPGYNSKFDKIPDGASRSIVMNSQERSKNENSISAVDRNDNEGGSLILNSDEDSELKDEQRNLQATEKLPLGSTDGVEQSMLDALTPPALIEPLKPLSKYAMGLDVARARYFNRLYGEGYALYGVYNFNRYFNAGLRLGYVNLREDITFSLASEIKDRNIQTSMHIFTQITPVNVWRIRLGIEAGYGLTQVKDIRRIATNPQPNIVEYIAEENSYGSNWFYLGAFMTVDITRRIRLGVTVGTNTATEESHIGGRVEYRF